MSVSAERQPIPYSLLTDRTIPQISSHQLQLFNYDNLNIRKIEQGFSVRTIEQVMWHNEGQEVLGVSIDNEQIVAIPFQVEGGKLKADTNRITHIANDECGKDYLPFLDAVALCARKDDTPVGIATIGNVRKTQLIHSPELSTFKKEFTRACDADFNFLFPTLYAVNKNEHASLKSTAIHAEKNAKPTRGILFMNNDFASFRGGVIKDGMIFPMEPANVPLETGETLIQHIATGRGIKEQLEQRITTSTPTTNYDQEKERESELTIDFYDYSALMTATAIAGMARSVWLMQGENDTVVALDGNMFRIPFYGQRVMQILRNTLGFEPPFFFTAPYSPNIAAEGAAISALTSQTIQRIKERKTTQS